MISKMIFNLFCLLFGNAENLKEVTEDDVLEFQLTVWFILLLIVVFLTVVRYI